MTPVLQRELTSTASYGIDKTIRERYVALGLPQSLDQGRDSTSVVQVKVAVSVLDEEVVISSLYIVLDLAKKSRANARCK